MSILVYSKIFTATVKAQATKQVFCEKCGQEYFYQMERTGSGRGQAIYGLGQQGAENRAMERAERDANNQLDKEVELVPCPRCNWVNKPMVRQYRKQIYRPLLLMAFVGGLRLVITGLIIKIVAIDQHPGEPISVWSPLCMFLGGLVFVGLLATRVVLQISFDPAKLHPALPKLPKNATLPLVRQVNPSTGWEFLVPVAYRDAAPQQMRQ